MKKLTPALLAGMAAVCIGASVASAADKPAMHEPVSSADFVTKASQAGMTEVELGKVALDKTQDKDVRAFADRMVKDHGKANQELTGIAMRKNMAPSPQLDAKHRAMVDELNGKSGAAFDAAYAHHMAMDHDKAVALFESASASKDVDSELSGFARKTLPTLKEHRKLADALNAHEGKEAQAGQSGKTY